MADQRVADRHFVEVRQAAEQHQVIEVEVVPGVDAETKRVRQFRGASVKVERRGGCGLPLRERPSERLGIQLDSVGTSGAGPADGFLMRISRWPGSSPVAVPSTNPCGSDCNSQAR